MLPSFVIVNPSDCSGRLNREVKRSGDEKINCQTIKITLILMQYDGDCAVRWSFVIVLVVNGGDAVTMIGT